MKSSIISALTLLVACACTTSGLVIPGADTPVFYFVSTSGSSGSSLLPLRLKPGGGAATLTGSGNIAKFYFKSGNLVAEDDSKSVYRTVLDREQTASGCGSSGSFGFTPTSSSNKCASYDGFRIQSNTENSQLGARLSLNFVGGFYSCGASQEIHYKVTPSDGPSGCTPVDLYTVPVVA